MYVCIYSATCMYVRFYSTSRSYTGGILIILERYSDKRKDNIDDDEDSDISSDTGVGTKSKYFSFVLQLLVAVI